MTTATKITFLRLILIPIMVIFLLIPEFSNKQIIGLSVNKFIAVIIFVFASFTDFLDGYIARKYDQVTNFGKFLDPIADKVLVLAAMTYLISIDRVTFWSVLIVIFREFLVTGIRLLAVEKGTVIAASPYGKAKTIVTMIALIIMMFIPVPLVNSTIEIIIQVVWYLAVLLTLISGLDYLIKNINVIKES